MRPSACCAGPRFVWSKAVVIALGIVSGAGATASLAQDFETGGATNQSGARLIEHGLPPDTSGFALEGLVVLRHGTPELTTHGLALAHGWRSLRLALGVSQTGTQELGWMAVGVGLGAAGPRGGAALRFVGRRDFLAGDASLALAPGMGAEAGGGAWMRTTERVLIRASAPQLWSRGVAPPLGRGLRVGVVVRFEDVQLWLDHEASPPGLPLAATHHAGVSLRSGPLTTWVTARDAPLRGAVGLSAGVAGLRLTGEAESHPVLGDTARLGITLRR